MKRIVFQLEEKFREAILAAVGFESDPLITAAQNEKFGDYQSNAAMGLAKQVAERTGQKTNPRAVAEQIKAKLSLGEMASEITIAGPGFINVRLSPAWLAAQLESIAADPRLGIETTGSPQKVVVDYSGPNIAKQMHVGHLRSTIIGDAISRVIEFQGHHVIRQNHIGDWGTQFGMLIAYLFRVVDDIRRSPENPDAVLKDIAAIGLSLAADNDIFHALKIGDLEAFYRTAKTKFDEDPAFQEEARSTVVRLQAGESKELAAWKRIVEESRKHFEAIYIRLGVKLGLEHERGESFYNPMLRRVVEDLKARRVATESEGAIVVFTEGFENPLIVEKTGGGFLYGTTDLAAIRYRIDQLGAQRIIYTTDSRQSQHFAQVFATARAAGWADGVSLEHAPFGTMLGEDGKPFKSRSGETVKLKDLLDEAEDRAFNLVTDKNPALPDVKRREIAHAVGIGAVKYSDLSKDRVSDYMFSWDKMLSFDGNTAPYLQNAYVRVHGIYRKAKSAGIDVDVSGASVRLDAPAELALAKQILRLGEVLDLVARELKPHHLTNYLYELATRFHAFFENCPVLQSEEPLRSSRLALCELTARTLGTGLDLLGIEHPEQM